MFSFPLACGLRQHHSPGPDLGPNEKLGCVVLRDALSGGMQEQAKAEVDEAYTRATKQVEEIRHHLEVRDAAINQIKKQVRAGTQLFQQECPHRTCCIILDDWPGENVFGAFPACERRC
jgi:hypothetical protein